MTDPACDFTGQIAFVASAVIGLAAAGGFAETCASVVLADLDGDRAADEAARILAVGGQAIVEFGRLDMTFNNAGIQVPLSDSMAEINRDERIARLGIAEEPPPCRGCACPPPASSSALRCPSTAASPRTDQTPKIGSRA